MQDISSRMDAVCRRFEELSMRLNQPDTAADPALFRKLMREYHDTEPVVEAYRDWQTALDHLAQAKALLEEPGSLDPDFKQMIQQEISEKSQDVAKLENNLKILLLPKDVNDGKNVIMEIRSGAGGEEAALFAHSLLRMYTMYAQNRGWTLEVLNLNETELGGVKEAIVSVDGAGAYNRLKYESGVHRVQRVPETETQGRIHTSTATVAVMPQAEEVDFALDMKDLRIDTFRSSGAGGQHINKTSSAIRVTHIPTGTVVECQNERSQFQNKDKALEILRSRLLAQKQKEQQDAINAQRQGQVGTGDRSEKIRTYNFPQDRVTDHRIGLLFLIEDPSYIVNELDLIIHGPPLQNGIGRRRNICVNPLFIPPACRAEAALAEGGLPAHDKLRLTGKHSFHVKVFIGSIMDARNLCHFLTVCRFHFFIRFITMAHGYHGNAVG